jgi:hypothetical protein
MSATKRFYEECAERGRCPVSPETFDYLDRIWWHDVDEWIECCEQEYRSIGGLLVSQDCITMESARRLVAEGLANDEIKDFVECFGDYRGVACTDCGCHRPIALVTRHGERFCADCE